MTAARSAPRPCPLCGNPTPTSALVEAHVGPTRQHPKADVVVWLCPPCANEVTDPNGPTTPPRKAHGGERKRRTWPPPGSGCAAASSRISPFPRRAPQGPGGRARTRHPHPWTDAPPTAKPNSPGRR